MKVEISFDDGQVGDLKAARLLSKYGFKGVFYVPSCEVPRTIKATLKEIKEGIVDLGHEIGGHTVSHPMDMKLITDDKDLRFEVLNNKLMIEHLLMKKPITKFCYPRGRHDERVRKAVQDAGYQEARTTRVLQIRNDTGDPFQTPTTIHIFPREEYGGVPWIDKAMEWFSKALDASQGDDSVFFHLWGHTNEIERHGDWERLEYFLAVMKNKLIEHGS